MRKRFLALLLAACIACTMLVVPASASSANTAVQTAVILGGLTADPDRRPQRPADPWPAGPAAGGFLPLP